MAETMTYNSLIQDLKNYLNNVSNLAISQYPRLIMMAETRLAMECKTLLTVLPVQGVLVPGTSALPKPSRWQETKSFIIATGAGFTTTKILYPRTYEYLREYNTIPATLGEPKYYADYDYDHYFFAPTPALAYPFELNFYQKPQPLDAGNQTNLFTDKASNLLLYACLLESAPYLKTDERLATWKDLYDRALMAVTGEQKERKSDQSQEANQ